jgi:hypothetical protein
MARFQRIIIILLLLFTLGLAPTASAYTEPYVGENQQKMLANQVKILHNQEKLYQMLLLLGDYHIDAYGLGSSKLKDRWWKLKAAPGMEK